jgi:hypothetical protein
MLAIDNPMDGPVRQLLRRSAMSDEFVPAQQKRGVQHLMGQPARVTRWNKTCDEGAFRMRLIVTNEQIKRLIDVSQGGQYRTQRCFFEDSRSGQDPVEFQCGPAPGIQRQLLDTCEPADRRRAGRGCHERTPGISACGQLWRCASNKGDLRRFDVV